MAVVGFDIGNENSYIAAVKSGGIEILDNEYNLRATPTYIAFTEKSRDIGVSARNKVITNFENTVFGFKRILGKQYEDSEFKRERSYLLQETCSLPSGDVGIIVNYLKNNVIFSVEQLMAMLLTKLKMITEVKLGCKVRDCVISVPVYYTDAQRRAMLDAANIAGLNALKLMDESAAVALAYGFFKQNLTDDPLNVAFVDLGNSALTVTACAFTKGKVKILGSEWDIVGGRDFDNKLAQYFVDDFKIRYGLDATTSKKALMALMQECENTKKLMSTNSLPVTLQLECFMQDKDVQGEMKRDIFEKLTVDLLVRIDDTLRRILKKTNLNKEDIHFIEIVGGSSRVPVVKEIIRNLFGKEPNATLNLDEAVARGCALQCALMSPVLKTRNFIVEDIPSYVIRIAWKNLEGRDEELEVFTFSDKIPACKAITISMSRPFSVESRFVDSRGNVQKIATFVFGNIPQDAEFSGVLKAKFKTCLDVHGIFSITSATGIAETAETVNETTNKSGKPVQVDVIKSDSAEILSPDAISEENKLISIKELCKLTISSDVPGLTKSKLNEYINAEKRMISLDAEEKEKSDARNALEECIYDARSKLMHEFSNFILEDDESRLLQYLQDMETWLYDNQEQSAAEYSKRMKEAKSYIDPVYKRYSEWEKRPFIITEYQQALQTANDAISRLSTDRNSTNLDDIENLRKVWQNSKQYLDEAVEMFSKMKMHQDLPLTTEDLRKSLTNFRNDFQKALFDVKSKIDSAKEATDSTGDGIDHVTKFSDDHNVSDLPVNADIEKQENSAA